MVIVFDTAKAREAMVPAQGAAVKLSAADVKRFGGKGRAIPLAVCRFFGESRRETLASALPYAGAAGVEPAAVAAFFRLNTRSVREKTVPYGRAATEYFSAAVKDGAEASTTGLVRPAKPAAA